MPLLRWAVVFARSASDLLRLLLCPVTSEADQLLELLIREAADPNVNREKRAFDLTRTS